MAERPRIFDDLAGVAGGALSALSGIRDEAEALGRARVDDTIRKLDLVKREQFEAVAELAGNARNAQEAADVVISGLSPDCSAGAEGIRWRPRYGGVNSIPNFKCYINSALHLHIRLRCRLLRR